MLDLTAPIAVGTVQPQIRKQFHNELAEIEFELPREVFSWARMDTFDTPVASKAPAFPDRVAAGFGARAIDANHTYAQATDANRVATPTADAALGNALSAQCVRANNTKYASSLAPADWSWFDGAAGAAVYCVCVTPAALTTDQWLLSTWNGAGNVAGEIYISSTATLTGRVLNLPSVAFSRTIASVPTNTPLLITLRHATTQSPDSILTASSLTTSSADYSSAPPGTTPAATMNLFAASFGASSFDGRVADVIFAQNVSPALDAKIRRYVYLRYRLNA